MIEAPSVIYLQILDEDGEVPDEVTWCVDRIHDTDAKYVFIRKARERIRAVLDEEGAAHG